MVLTVESWPHRLL